MSYGIEEYRALVSRFAELVRSSVPEDATILVVSKGDQELLDIGVCTAWHFPQRTDGTYAGYYPFDSASAISHLEALRKKGGEYLAFPASALWWLDHYAELRQHLDRCYRVASQDSDAGVIYELGGAAANGNGAAPVIATGKPPDAPEPAKKESAIEMLFSTEYYAEQSNRSFRTLDEALAHYEDVGQHEGLDPHPLFDTRWYLSQNPDAGKSGSNPLLHFIEHSTVKGLDPNPYFDTEYYYSQVPRLRKAGVNALVHYVDPESRAAHPNPLFRDGFYRNNSRNARSSAPTPLEHYLRYGKAEGRATSHIHEKLLSQVRGDTSALQRGRWTKGTVLWFTKGAAAGRWPTAPSMADHLAAEHHIGSLLISYAASPPEPGTIRSSEPFVLEDYALACEVFRPSALRLLAFALTGSNPLFAVCDAPEILETLAGNGVECYFLFPDDSRGLSDGELDLILRHSRRVVVSSKDRAKAISKRAGRLRRKVSACLPARGRPSADAYADALLKLVSKDLGVTGHRPARRRRKIAQPKIVIPCSDWAVSGVNASMESIGLQLLELGWDLEVLFTRDEAAVRDSALDHPLPLLPYRFLERDRKGPPGVWNALLGDLESQAPCILFMAYDFLANSVAPALTEGVGIVSWVQADDRDYYEQVYRLGRYCNAVICVSEVLRDHVAELNPVIGERTRVIHNSSVRQGDIARRRARKGDRMRLVYTGRLVQYQKRILDFIDLAQALDRTGVPYEITLIGTFSAHDETAEAFERLGAPHIADGRIVLAGRMRREEIMRALTAQDFFVLLSDFEGLPLALVEAMARGCAPVTAQSPSGIPEIITSGENGYIVEGRDYDAWAALLTELWRDPQAQTELSRNARATIRNRFTVERIGAEFDQAFRQVAEEIQSGKYERPRSLNWGGERSHAGDVLPSPNLFRPASLQIPGLQ
jgi:glycosyltransferase involved in cell wall biosynthesis